MPSNSAPVPTPGGRVPSNSAPVPTPGGNSAPVPTPGRYRAIPETLPGAAL